MKSTQIKEARRNILKKIISFLSICLIFMLGVGGFLTTNYVYNSMSVQAKEYYQERNYGDFTMISSGGFSEEDIEKIKALDGVNDAEGVQVFTAGLSTDSGQIEVELISMTDRISVPELISGHMPQRPDECLIAEDLGDVMKLDPGDKLRLAVHSEDIDPNVLKYKEFTVCGIMHHPEYIRLYHEYPVVLPREAFDNKVLGDACLRLFIKADTPEDKNIFEDPYFEKTKPIMNRLESNVDAIEEDQTIRIQKAAHEKIDEEWEKVDKKLSDANQKIKDGEDELNEQVALAEAQLQEGRDELEKGRQELVSAERKLNKEEKRYKKARKFLPRLLDKLSKMNSSELEEYLTDPDKAAKEYVKLAGRYANKKKLNKTIDKCLDLISKEKYSQAKDTVIKYLEGEDDRAGKTTKSYRKKIEAGWAEYDNGKAMLEDAESQLITKEKEGRAKIKKARRELKEKTEEAQSKVEEARSEADELDSRIIILDRLANGSFLDIYSTVGSIKAVGPAFGLLFLIVAAMVCFSTLVIIIDEQKKLVGTTKAFGFRGNEILGKYLIFGVSAAIAGSLAGIALGALVAKIGIHSIYKMGVYIFTAPPVRMTLVPSVAVCLGAVILSIIITVLACTDLLKSPASLLMQGDTLRSSKARNNSGKGAGSFGSLFTRLVIRNMLNDKARVIVFIVIIAGSTLLIGTGFTLKFAIDKMPDTQLREVLNYDLKVGLGNSVDDKELKAIKSTLENKGIKYAEATFENHLHRIDHKDEGIQIMVMDTEDADKINTLKDPNSGKDLEVPDTGVLVQRKLSEHYGLEKGDTLQLYDNRLHLHEVEIKGIVQNYYGRTISMSAEEYTRIFEKKPETNELYITLDKADGEDTIKELNRISEDLTYEYSDAFTRKFKSLSGLINIVIVLMTSIAILMSFLILMNLINIFVNRRKKEVIIMRVNGFRHSEALRYLAYETVFNIVLGLALGTLIGCSAGSFIVKMIEAQDIQFLRVMFPMAWIIAVLLETAFAIIVVGISFRKVKHFLLREIAE